MVSALTYRHDFDLLERVETSYEPEAARAGITSMKTWSSTSSRPASESKSTIPGRRSCATAIKSQTDVLDILPAKTSSAPSARWIGSANVRGPAVLPYNYQLVLLADALRDTVILSDEQRSRLRLWFWATALGEYFRGISKSLFERAQKDLRQVVWEPLDPFRRTSSGRCTRSTTSTSAPPNHERSRSCLRNKDRGS